MTEPPASAPAFTGLVIPASPVPAGLATFRRRHIHHPGAAVPFHTTIVAPFLPLAEFDEEARARLGRAVAGLPPFDYEAGSICCFPTTNVLWLAPSPVRPFEDVAEALHETFPRARPAAGLPTFHLTVALGRDAADVGAAVNEFRAGFEQGLPFRLRARHLDLYAEVDGGYRRLARYPLGASRWRRVDSSGGQRAEGDDG